MKINEVTLEKAEVQLSIQELASIINAFNEVRKALFGWEFETRMGLSCERVEEFYDSISRFLEEPIELVNLDLSMDEIYILNNTLNEVCNGIYVNDFETKLGTSRREMKLILNLVNKAMNKMS